MSQLLFETIRLENGVVHNLEYHQSRLDKSRLDLLGFTDKLSLADAILTLDFPEKGLWKCRVTYAELIENIEFSPYEIKKIERVLLVENDKIKYPHKFIDRIDFENISAQYPDYQEVIITQRGHFTDSTWASLAFFDGQNWFTPATFLLPSTRRQQLLDAKILTEKTIRVVDLMNYESFAFISSMRGLETIYSTSIIE
jgi:4-amino-4-deoxychorismate lyase